MSIKGFRLTDLLFYLFHVYALQIDLL